MISKVKPVSPVGRTAKDRAKVCKFCGSNTHQAATTSECSRMRRTGRQSS